MKRKKNMRRSKIRKIIRREEKGREQLLIMNCKRKWGKGTKKR